MRQAIELIEGARKTVTKKWQGYPPEHLNVIGTMMPALPEVSIPRFTGTAEYASRVRFPDMLHARFLTSPHPRARITSIDTSAAGKMPGVAYILTHQNAPPLVIRRSGPQTATTSTPRGNRLVPPAMPRDLNLQGEAVAIVAAETEDLAEDAIAAIKVEYEVLPFVSTLKEVMAPGAPDLRGGKGNLIRTWTSEAGDIARGFAEADIVKEFEYHFAGAVSVPMQPSGSVARWDGDRLTIWGMGQGIYPVRDALAETMGMDPAKIRFINKWNGSTFGSGRLAAERYYPLIAHLAKVTGRPVRVMLPKDQELAQLHDQAGDADQVQGRRHQGRTDRRAAARDPSERRRRRDRLPRVGPGQRDQPARALHLARASLAIGMVGVQDQRAAAGAVAQLHPAGNQVVVGSDDGRDGRDARPRSARVPAEAHHAAHARRRSLPLRLVRLGRGAD